MRHTILVVTCKEELGFLPMQMSNFKKYLDPEIYKLHLVVNTDTKDIGPLDLQKIHKGLNDCPLFYQIEMADPNITELMPDGWRSQQYYKLEAAKRITTPYYTSIDAKHFFQKKPVFVDHTTKRILTSLDIATTKKHQNIINTAAQYVGADNSPAGMVCCLPPVTMITNEVQELLDEHSDLHIAMANNWKLMDYFVYNAWMHKKNRLMKEYIFSERQSCNVMQNHDENKAKGQCEMMHRYMMGSYHRKWFKFTAIVPYIRESYKKHTSLSPSEIDAIIEEVNENSRYNLHE